MRPFIFILIYQAQSTQASVHIYTHTYIYIIYNSKSKVNNLCTHTTYIQSLTICKLISLDSHFFHIIITTLLGVIFFLTDGKTELYGSWGYCIFYSRSRL